MKHRLFALVGLSLAAALPAAAEDAAPAFDLYQSTDGGRTTVAVALAGAKTPLAVAAGAEDDLDLLAEPEAASAFAALLARADAEVAEAMMASAEGHDPNAAIGAMGPESAKIEKKVIRKVGAHADANAAAASLAEGDEDGARIVLVRESDGEGPSEKIITIEKQTIVGEAPAEGAPETLVIETARNGEASRLVRISRASADGARDFIGDANGLDAAERAQMFAKAGL